MIQKRRPQALLLLAVVISAFASQGFAPAQSGTGSLAKTQSRQAPKGATASPVPPSNLPPCPEAGVPAPRASSITGHHKVTLTWNASAPSADAASNPVGYCLYRSKKQGLPKMAMAMPNAHCGGCEQVNRVPIAGTGCVDDLVEDNTTYYYAVTAITALGQSSSSSDEVIAEIRGRKNATAVPSTYPSCRALRSSK